MTQVQLENKILNIENRILKIEETVQSFQKKHVSKTQWKHLDKLREEELNSLFRDIDNIKKQIEGLLEDE